MNPRLPVIVLLISSIGWGLTWWPVKQLNALGLDSLWLILIAFATGTLVLLPWFYWQRGLWKTKIHYMLWVALAGGVANVAFQLAIYYGDVIRVMILFYLLPVWSVIGGRIFLGEKIDALRVLAVMMCLAGAIVILDIANAGAMQAISWIDVLAVISGMALAITNILFRSVQEVPVMSKIAFMFMGSSVLILLLLIFFTAPVVQVSSATIVLAMLYGAVWLMLITLGTQWSVTQMEAGRSAIILVMELVAAVVSAALLTDNNLHWHEMAGSLLVVTAAMVEGLRVDNASKPI